MSAMQRIGIYINIMTSFYDLVKARIKNMDIKNKNISEESNAELDTLKLFSSKSYVRDSYIKGMKNAIKFLDEIK